MRPSAYFLVGIAVLFAAGSWATDQSTSATAPSVSRAFTGRTQIELTVDADDLTVHMSSHERVRGLLVFTFLESHREPLVATLKFESPSDPNVSFSATKHLPFEFEGRRTGFYKLEVFEAQDGQPEMRLIGSVVVTPAKPAKS